MTKLHCQRCNRSLVGAQQKWCSENCRKRHWEQANRPLCPRCGAPMQSAAGRQSTATCRACWIDLIHAQHRSRLERVAAMYRAGLSTREIATRLGYGPLWPPEITEARRLGLIDYRLRDS